MPYGHYGRYPVEGISMDKRSGRRNPFNYLSPVEDESRLIGREEELEDLLYYTGQAEQNEYYHAAVVGDRASGKTSLVNVLSEKLESRGHLPVRVTLDSDLVSDQAEFFREFYEAIISEMKSCGALDKGFYQRFRRAFDQLEVESLDLGFASVYVGTKGTGKVATDVPHRVLVDDLQGLYQKLDDVPSIVVVVDEADFLSENATILQKLRNILTDISGFNIVLSGTNALFSEFEDVFSPLSRSLKRVTVGPFDDPETTKKCILAPLEEEEQEDVDNASIPDVHELTGGSPYEINLVAHYMYRRYTEGTDEIRLSAEVLDEVAAELERIRTTAAGETALQLADFPPSSLSVLVGLLELGAADEETLRRYTALSTEGLDIGGYEEAAGDARWTISHLLSEDIIVKEDGLLRAPSHQFDRLYLKYLSVSEGCRDDPPIPGVGRDDVLQPLASKLIFDHLLADDFSDAEVHIELDQGSERFSRWMIGAHNKTIPAGESRTILQIDIEEEARRLREDLPNSLRFRVDFEWLDRGVLVQVRFEENGDKQVRRLEEKLERLNSDLRRMGFKVRQEDEITLLNRGKRNLDEGNEEKAEELFRESIEIRPSLVEALAGLADVYENKGSYEEALEKTEAALEHRPKHPFLLLKKGILLVELGRASEAVAILEEAKSVDASMPMVWHNLGRAYLNKGEMKTAADHFDQAYEIDSEDLAICHGRAVAHLQVGSSEVAFEMVESLESASEEERPVEGREILYLRGLAEMDLGRPEKARKALRKAKERGLTHDGVLVNLAALELEMGQEERAKDALKEVSDWDIDDLNVEDSPTEEPEERTDSAR